MALTDEKHLINDSNGYHFKRTTTKCKLVVGIAILIPTLLAIGCAVAIAVLGVKLSQANKQGQYIVVCIWNLRDN